jgi:hypothetical protein
MARVSFASALVNGQVPGVKIDQSRFTGKTGNAEKDAATVARELLHREPSASTLAAIDKGLQGKPPAPGLIAALVISSPEFQRR